MDLVPSLVPNGVSFAATPVSTGSQVLQTDSRKKLKNFVSRPRPDCLGHQVSRYRKECRRLPINLGLGERIKRIIKDPAVMIVQRLEMHLVPSFSHNGLSSCAVPFWAGKCTTFSHLQNSLIKAVFPTLWRLFRIPSISA